jgi:heptosyltransferase-2
MKRILIIRTDRLGDTLLSTPVFRAVREGYPDSYIAAMVRPYTRECVEGNPYINETIIYDKRGRQKSIMNSLKFAFDLRRKRFDTALILHPTNRVNLITFLAGIPERVGFDRKLGFLLTRKISHKKEFGERHELDYALDIVRAIGLTPRNRSLFMPLRRATRKRIDNTLSDLGVSAGDRLIALHPSSSCPSKKWLPERFASVADMLIEEYGVKVVLVGGRDGKPDAEKTKMYMKHSIVDLSGKTTVSELGSLLKRCALFISNDSGPVHVASAVGTPVVAIFGRKDAGLGPTRWGPVGRRDRILHKETECERCLAHNCTKDFLCLKAINEEEVLKEAAIILNSYKQEEVR